MSPWSERERRQEERYADGLRRLETARGARRDRQLLRTANAASGAGLAALMQGRRRAAAAWFRRAAARYRESCAGAPAAGWGRVVAALKMRLLAGDAAGAAADARWALEAGAAQAESPIGRYAAVLAFLVLAEDERALALARELRAEPDDGFPHAVADALSGLAGGDERLYAQGLTASLRSFETRGAHLGDLPVADTVLALEALAEPRGLAAQPSSALLPPPRSAGAGGAS